MTVRERAAQGKAVRKRVKRSSHRDWAPPQDRPPPRQILGRQDESRVPELVPIRYGRMLASPFYFFRGAAAIMSFDLASRPNSGLEAQLCGDAHLSNFGVFAAPERRLVFDVNDFDETLPGPFEWDVKRLAASFAVAGREFGFSDGERRRTTLAPLREYRKAMRRFARMRDLEVWYARADVETVSERWGSRVTNREVKAFEKGMAKASNKDSMRALSKLTRRVNGVQRIISNPPLIIPIEELSSEDQSAIERRLEGLVSKYRETLDPYRRVLAARYRYVHAAHKVVGVGSVGAQAWILLLLGRDSDDPLVMQAKEAQRSVLEPFAGPAATCIRDGGWSKASG